MSFCPRSPSFPPHLTHIPALTINFDRSLAKDIARRRYIEAFHHPIYRYPVFSILPSFDSPRDTHRRSLRLISRPGWSFNSIPCITWRKLRSTDLSWTSTSVVTAAYVGEEFELCPSLGGDLMRFGPGHDWVRDCEMEEIGVEEAGWTALDGLQSKSNADQ